MAIKNDWETVHEKVIPQLDQQYNQCNCSKLNQYNVVPIHYLASNSCQIHEILQLTKYFEFFILFMSFSCLRIYNDSDDISESLSLYLAFRCSEKRSLYSQWGALLILTSCLWKWASWDVMRKITFWYLYRRMRYCRKLYFCGIIRLSFQVPISLGPAKEEVQMCL